MKWIILYPLSNVGVCSESEHVSEGLGGTSSQPQYLTMEEKPIRQQETAVFHEGEAVVLCQKSATLFHEEVSASQRRDKDNEVVLLHKEEVAVHSPEIHKGQEILAFNKEEEVRVLHEGGTG